MGHLHRAALVLALSLAADAQAADNLSFKGNLVQEACTLRPGDEAVTLELWDVTSKHLYINTRSQGKDFRLHLENCDTTIGATVSITLAAGKTPRCPACSRWMAAVAPQASGWRIETPSNKPLPLNLPSDAQVLIDGSNVIALKAFVQGEPQAISDQTIGQGAYRVT